MTRAKVDQLLKREREKAFVMMLGLDMKALMCSM